MQGPSCGSVFLANLVTAYLEFLFIGGFCLGLLSPLYDRFVLAASASGMLIS